MGAEWNSNREAAPAAKIPILAAAGRHDARHLFTELLQGRPPRHEMDTHPLITHGEPAGREGHMLAADARL